MTKSNFIIVAPLVIILSGIIISCSTPKNYRSSSQTIYAEQLYNQNLVSTILYNQYKEWKGTPYKTGGLSKKGIDCSGLVYLTFKYKFGVELPRTTKKQVDLGKLVNKNNLFPGDLIFFKTGIWNRHVGIFIEMNKFMHSSTSRGVIISSLDDEYWRKKYYLAKRIDF
jgi:cell wall-associated NlpC family hydrolase